MDSRLALLTLARTYSAATGRSLARIATLIHDQGALFKKLEAGGSCTIATFDKAVHWFSDHWPADAAWPEGIVRPARTPASDPAPSEAA